MDTIRAAAVAGTFYPGSASELTATVDHLLDAVAVVDGPCPKALIVPHAGYIYSGPIAASAFARVRPYGDRITRVVLVGPAHRVFVPGLVSPGATKLATPLGTLSVDTAALASAGIEPNAAAHAREHSLEVELPFIQRVAPEAQIIPLAGTRADAADVGRVLEQLWGGPETLIVISTDLSHYLPYAEGRAIDQDTCNKIVAGEPVLERERACGSIGINGLTWVARRKQLRIELLDLRSSGDTAGSRDEVVGYRPTARGAASAARRS
ncbi:MAG: AmmeMemoRadiSam system protein B [Kofleriaceae bacterium]|nr:AmmeMemoRadiSam system protein B [Kofleriaceae bacterium]